MCKKILSQDIPYSVTGFKEGGIILKKGTPISNIIYNGNFYDVTFMPEGTSGITLELCMEPIYNDNNELINYLFENGTTLY